MARPALLDDHDWLARRYASVGDAPIASELGVSRETVRHARERLGIESAPRGRRRSDGGTRPRPQAMEPDQTAAMIIERFQREVRLGAAAGPALVATRIRAVHDASNAGDELALEDAIAAAASGLALWHSQLLRVRTAPPAVTPGEPEPSVT